MKTLDERGRGMTEKHKRFIVEFAYWAIILALVFIIFKYFLPLIMPFFIAFLFSALLRPVVKFLNVKCRFRYNIAAVLCVVIFYVIIGFVLIAIGARVISGVSRLVSALPALYSSTVEPELQRLFAELMDFSSRMSPEVAALFNKASETLISSAGSFVTNISSGLLSAISSLAGKLPGWVVSTIICIIATIFLTIDFPKLTEFLMRQLPHKAKSFVRSVKLASVNVLFRYGKSYALIMCITIAELAIGLSLIGVNNAIPMAVLIGICDIFPVIGSGLFLWPWAIILFLQDRVGQAIGMVALYIVITVIRQYLEPKIIGGHIGMHPLATLMCMFIGASLFGAIGLFGLPILAAVILNLEEAGIIHIFKKDSEDEPDGGESGGVTGTDSADGLGS